MYVTGPKIVKQVLHQDVSHEVLGGAEMHSRRSGAAHFRSPNESDCFLSVKKLLDYIPHNSVEKGGSILPARLTAGDTVEELGKILPDIGKKSYDIKKIIELVFDKGSFFETQELFAPNMITGFAKLESATIGVLANQPNHLAGVIDCDASDKASRFIRYCDAFNIPLVSFTDAPGFMPRLEQEEKGIIRHGAILLVAFSESTVLKINIIIRKAYGGAYIAMNSKHVGADFVFAWPSAEIAVMGAEGAVSLLEAVS